MENPGCSTGVTLGSEALSDLVWTKYSNLLVNVPLSLRLNPEWCITIFCDHILLDLMARPFKSQFSAGAGHSSVLNDRSGTVFSLSDDKDVQLIGHHSSSCPLSLTIFHPT